MPLIRTAISFAFVACLFLGGCGQPSLDSSKLDDEQQIAEEVITAANLERDQYSADLKQAVQRATAADEKAAAADARYQEANKRAAAFQVTVAETQRQLADANQRIAAAQKALAENEARHTTTADKTEPLAARVLSWNVESDGSDPQIIAKQLTELSGYDVYALTEVLPEAFSIYAKALGSDYQSVESKSGNSDRLQILFNQKRFELVRKFELNDINFEYRYRSPLVVHLRDRESGSEMMVMVNHLARGKAAIRTQQAGQLVEWARDQNLPIVAVGDYNYDYVFADKNGNEGFREMLKDNIWSWIEPSEMIDTNWFDNPSDPDGKDDYPGSMLDFAFVAGSAKTWKFVCNVIVRDNDFPDDAQTSDHRPFELIINED